MKFIQAYQAQGIPVHAITIQNEPEYATADYPSMSMTASEQAGFVKFLGPAFADNSITSEIIIWDHNWDNTSYALDVLNDAVANPYIAGSAWHGYNGLPAAQMTVHDTHPDKNIYFTEISGNQAYVNFAQNLRWSLHNILIGAVRNWARTALYWNLALDKNHGPSIRPPAADPVDQMRGIVTIDSDSGSVDYEVEYYAIGHLSKFVIPGAYRIKSDTYVNGAVTENPEPADGFGVVETAAFLNPDGSKVLVVLNPSWHNAYTFDVRWNGKHFSYTLPRESVVTFKW